MLENMLLVSTRKCCNVNVKEFCDRKSFQIPGQNAIEMVMAISPLIKISDKIRDLFIDVLRQAIYDR